MHSEMKLKKSFILISILCCLYLQSNGQTDSTNKPTTKTTFLIGVCATLKFYQRFESPLPPNTPKEKIPPTYFGPTFSIYHSRIKNEHFMFQSGVEYTYAKYYVANYSESSGKYSGSYSAMKFVVHTITIPAYFNLLMFKRKAYIGIGPNFDVCPYTTGSGNKDIFQQEKIKNQRFFSHLVDIGATAKIGLNFKFGKDALTFEARLKSGIRSVFSGGTVLINEYCSLVTGYTF